MCDLSDVMDTTRLRSAPMGGTAFVHSEALKGCDPRAKDNDTEPRGSRSEVEPLRRNSGRRGGRPGGVGYTNEPGVTTSSWPTFVGSESDRQSCLGGWRMDGVELVHDRMG